MNSKMFKRPRESQVLGLVALLILAPVLCLANAEVAAPLEAEQSQKKPFLFSTPAPGIPTTVFIEFYLEGINYISSVEETLEFTGTITLTWKDPRVAFNPQDIGVPEILYQGYFQFDEVATGWYPQVVLVNGAGSIQKSGVQLRILPDGTSILKEKVTAVAEVDFNMRSFPFDSHQLKAAFEILGHASDEIDLRVVSEEKGGLDDIKVPEWSLADLSWEIQRIPATSAMMAEKQQAVLGLAVQRQSFFARRLIMLPMTIIVLLASSIFWMDKSSLSDRNSVSFIGVLTAVAYQQIVVNVMPPVSYFTFMHGLLGISFLVMSLTVPVNLIVAHFDKRGEHYIGDRIDRTGRWLFPLVYISGCIVLFLVTRET